MSFFAPILALLSPECQQQVEMDRIVRSEEFRELLHKDAGSYEIEKNGHSYKVKTSHYTLEVDVEYLPTDRIGPAQFTLHFHDPVEIN